VISQILKLLTDSPNDQIQYAINISPPSIKQDGFMGWLEEKLQEYKQVAPRMIFELPEYGVVANIDKVTELLALVTGYGARLSIDHFGRSFGSLAYLRSMKVHYLKIDGSFMRSIEQNSDNQFFVQALAEIAHGLEIEVIAEAIETKSAWELLPSLHMDGAQGYFIGRPE
jgi:EAL domain-containing protein (putative c-di-GMP-specific phosphodiesterase class I)